MNSKLDEYNRGIFKYKTETINLSKEEIHETIPCGEEYDSSIELSTDSTTYIKGIAYSSHEFVQIIDKTFSGIKNSIRYKVITGFDNNEDIKGNITIVTNCGEVMVPFIFNVQHPKFDSSIGEIRDLFQFADLVKVNPSEALEIFISSRFEKTLISKDIKTELLYRSFIKSTNKRIAMEEFLVAIRKKSPTEIDINKKSFEYNIGADKEEFRDTFNIKIKNWGYCEYKIMASSPFIRFDKEFVSNEDFVANKCKIQFYINPKLMHKGNNEALIEIKSTTDKKVVKVICHNNPNMNLANEVHDSDEKLNVNDNIQMINNANRLIKRDKYHFTKNYLDFRMGNINLDKYLTENEELIKELCALEDNQLNQLFKIHLYIMSGQKERAVQVLEDFEEVLNDSDEVDMVARCGYMYLKTLLNDDKDFVKIATRTISNNYENIDDSWKILWMLFYLDKKYESNYSNKIKAIKEQYEKGCTSPIMYYEVCAVYNKDYTLLRNLGDFEIQILNWATKKNCVSKELALAYASLAVRYKEFNPLVYKSLAVLYGRYEQDEILTAICTLLIKAQMCGPTYFKWYKLGVSRQLKITQLYESYMYSYDESSNEPLLEPLLIYFTFNSNLADNKKAYLYASVIKNKNNNPSIYNTYLPQIKQFADKQLKAHVINENLKVIYEELFTSDNITEDMAKDLPYIMFKYDISCYRPEYVGAVVVHKVLSLEQYVKFNNGKAQINIFTESAEIFLVDKEGNRYVRNNFYTLKKLFNISDLIDKCYEYNQSDGMLILYIQDKIDNYYRNDIQGKIVKKEVIRVPHLSNEYKKKYLYDLINYTYENNEVDLLDKYLGMIEIDGMSPKEKSYIIEYMIIRGFKEKALEAIITYGYSNIPTSRLLKLATTTLEAMETDDSLNKYEELVIGICSYVFENNKYNEVILKYLAERYVGSTEQMYMLWSACREYDHIDTNSLEENILAQMLFAQSFVPNSLEVFINYYNNYKTKKVVKAYLMYNSYKYVVKDRILDDEFFVAIKNELSMGNNEMYSMALLKFYSTKDDYTKDEIEFIDKTVRYFVTKDVILPFFKGFKDVITLPEYVADKYYVEYVTDPESKVNIHYCLDENGMDELRFSSETMRDVFYGIRVKEFILFYEDDLQYYIVEDSNGDVNITESNDILVDECDTDDETRYSKINLMLSSRSIGDEKTLIEVMESLAITDYMAQEMFKPL
ncbi:MAG: hypothetical protein E7262_04185 [Lachnospiraceae bacterium]|nr:hypothetical protein [Lachnospiraceae bacterium]